MRALAFRLICLVPLAAFFACEGPVDAPTTPSELASKPMLVQNLVTVPVTFDITPGSCPNTINRASKGKTSVAIAGSSLLDVTDIDASSVLLEGVAPLKWAVDDTTSPGGCCDPIALFRVNAGGPLLANVPDWTEDTASDRSPYVNTGTAASTIEAIDMSHPSIPPGTPMSLFQTERWDYTADPEMRWEFPVDEGMYTVRLYFAEIYPPNFIAGKRIFDVYLEGDLVLDDYDIAAEVGGFAGVVKQFSAMVVDGGVTIDFGHVLENPKIQAIEISTVGSAPPPDGIDDLVLKFSTQDLVAAMGMFYPGDELELTLTGTLLDGTPFSDTDCMVAVGRKD